MSTITKERVAEIIHAAGLEPCDYEAVFESIKTGEIVAMARIALASLEAELCTSYVSDAELNAVLLLHRLKVDGHSQLSDAFRAGFKYARRTALPAPVVPDFGALTKCIVQRLVDYGAADDDAIASAEEFVYNACRAAMLQVDDGNSPAQSGCCPAQNCIPPAQCGNLPVIPDGWVACSERMPDIGTEIFYFCQGDGLRDCGIVSSSNFSGRGDAQLYVHAEGYDLRFGVDITHWMPLPAAPQQEVK